MPFICQFKWKCRCKSKLKKLVVVKFDTKFRSSRPEGFCKKRLFLEILQNSQENTCAWVSFLIKLQVCNFIKKETVAQVFSCDFCEISRNSFSYRTPPVSGGYFCKLLF